MKPLQKKRFVFARAKPDAISFYQIASLSLAKTNERNHSQK